MHRARTQIKRSFISIIQYTRTEGLFRGGSVLFPAPTRRALPRAAVQVGVYAVYPGYVGGVYYGYMHRPHRSEPGLWAFCTVLLSFIYFMFYVFYVIGRQRCFISYLLSAVPVR